MMAVLIKHMNLFRGVLLIIFLMITFPVQAWNDTGHRVIATIAYTRLSPEAQKNVDYLTKQLFHYGDGYQRFLKASVWPDDLRSQVNLFNGWHFINYPWTIDSSKTEPPAKINLVTALIQSMSIVSDKKNNTALRLIMLSMFIHLVGDAHQPLHCINLFSHRFPHGDEGGNDYPIIVSKDFVAAYKSSGYRDRMRGFNNAKNENLHSFWDQGLGLFSPPYMSYKNYKAYIQKLAEHFTQEFPQTVLADQVEDLQPNDWVQESFKLAKNEVYDIPLDGKVTPLYLNKGQDIVAKQSALAGYRLAAILNRFLEN